MASQTLPLGLNINIEYTEPEYDADDLNMMIIDAVEEVVKEFFYRECSMDVVVDAEITSNITINAGTSTPSKKKSKSSRRR